MSSYSIYLNSFFFYSLKELDRILKILLDFEKFLRLLAKAQTFKSLMQFQCNNKFSLLNITRNIMSGELREKRFRSHRNCRYGGFVYKIQRKYQMTNFHY